MIDCQRCAFFSSRHHSCFHPEAWTEGAPWPDGFGYRQAGNPEILNAKGDCQLFDDSPVHTNGQLNAKNWLKKIFRRKQK